MKQNFDVFFSEGSKTFIKSLDPKVRKKVAFNIHKSRVIKDSQFFKKLTDQILEFRTRYDKVQVRLLAFWDKKNNSMVVCSHGFIKKIQKVPQSELDKALKFRNQYLKSEV